MIQAFEGIIDGSGLCTLHQDGGSLRLHSADAKGERIPFWAVMDHRCAATIVREIFSGNRARALRLLEESALSLGSKVLPD